MPYPWIDAYLLGKPGVTKDIQPDWNWVRYHVGGKLFAAVCRDDGNKPYYITLKLPPAQGDLLRQQYSDILPGYYMNKVHWNSIRAEGSVPEALVRDMLDSAYGCVFSSLPKKKQKELLE